MKSFLIFFLLCRFFLYVIYCLSFVALRCYVREKFKHNSKHKAHRTVAKVLCTQHTKYTHFRIHNQYAILTVRGKFVFRIRSGIFTMYYFCFIVVVLFAFVCGPKKKKYYAQKESNVYCCKWRSAASARPKQKWWSMCVCCVCVKFDWTNWPASYFMQCHQLALSIGVFFFNFWCCT